MQALISSLAWIFSKLSIKNSLKAGWYSNLKPPHKLCKQLVFKTGKLKEIYPKTLFALFTFSEWYNVDMKYKNISVAP